jgi:hypothetical protein
MDSTKEYSSYTLPRNHPNRSSKYASPALVPLVADSIITTSAAKSRPTSVEPSASSSDGFQIPPKLKVCREVVS